MTQLLLSPISVHPDYFRRGIATAMMKEAFQIAQELGYTAVFRLRGFRNFTIALDSGDLMNSGFTMWRTSPAAGMVHGTGAEGRRAVRDYWDD